VDYLSRCALRRQYCQQVGGYIGFDQWLSFDYSATRQEYICSNDYQMSEGLANAVGFYIAVGPARASADVRFPKEAIAFIEGPFARFLKGWCEW
jgi:hypothetical protein